MSRQEEPSHDTTRRHDRDLGWRKKPLGSRDYEGGRAASDMGGWVAVQLLREVDEPRRRAIIGTWQSREHWVRSHDDDERFKATRAEQDGLEDRPSTTVWYDVVEEHG